jgi:tripeptidyl-peptidase-1
MSKFIVLAVLATLAVVLVAVAAEHPGQRVYMQKEVKKVPAQWMPMASVAVEQNKIFNVIFALKQRNTDKLSRIFEAVTNPESNMYGQYLTIDQITAIVEPSEETIEKVVAWLAYHGVTDYTMTKNRDHLFADIPLSTVSVMFDVQFTTYMHTRTGRVFTTTVQPHSVPSMIAEHLDFVVGFSGFPMERRQQTRPSPDTDFYQVGPQELRQRYNITQIQPSHPRNKQAVAEFQGEYYSPSDLQTFMKQFYPTNSDPKWWTATVKGTNSASNPSTEGSLDIEYIMGVAPSIPTEFWSMANFDFYSDLTRWYTMIEDDAASPWVHSVSYGSQGDYPSKSYQARWDTEMQKIGLRGISIIFASGDSGAGCYFCEYLEPSFPAVSTYVTSVGATHFLQYGVGPEGAVTQFSSGGGLSWNDAIPSYQKQAVDKYFAVAKNIPASSYYNRQGRATPDVSALGIGYKVLQGGSWGSVGGTSASAPTFAAVISLLNNIRLQNGKPTLGFLNPWIYQTAAKNPTAFFDVTQGNNQYLCCPGFYTAPGYDPVTGVGTPNFEVLRTLMP